MGVLITHNEAVRYQSPKYLHYNNHSKDLNYHMKVAIEFIEFPKLHIEDGERLQTQSILLY